MIAYLLDKLLGLDVMRTLRITTTPRWVILLIDLLIVSASYAMMVAFDVNAHHVPFKLWSVLLNWLIIVLVYFLVTYISKSYTCVIRLSAIEDLYRTFMVVACSTVILLVLNYVVAWMTQSVLYSYWNVFFVGALSFSLMMIERLVIKYLYLRLTSAMSMRLRVLVLGTSLDSLILANALKNEIGGRYEPVGMLSIKTGKEVQQINGFKVYRYNPAKLADLFVGQSIHALIFNADNRDILLNGMADQFIQNNIKLLSINKVEEFEVDVEAENQPANISTYIHEVDVEDLLGRAPIVLNNSLVSNNIEGECVLITGACGSIGSEIVRQVAVYKARKIVLVDQAETPMHDISLEMQRRFPDVDIELFIGDVQNLARMEQAFEQFRPRYVFHAAAYKHVPMMELNPTEAVLTNVQGTRNIADLALKYGVYKFVMISTDKAVNPTNVMGCSKRLAEIYCQSLFFDAQRRGIETQYITTRFGNVLGSNGSVIPLFRKQIESGGPVTVTHKEIIRYFMTIPEACSLVLEAGCMGHGGEIYIFDMGKPVKIYDLAVRMISLAGLRPNIDIKIEEVGLRPGEKLYEELLNDKENTTVTVNKKIMIAKVRTYDYRVVCDRIGEIVRQARLGNVNEMVYAMKKFVPEYKSNQSVFEEIDRQIEEDGRLKPQVTPETEKYY